ncbi:MAG: GNAT family N-acetyltransferase [Chitinophagaceae bacterium]|jgi:N-acetylglutamate synthase-like GNAT family acetyltransferase|nr:GNAT family N-acetyltransferase [Chitinophagaceae bacterium]
MQQVNKTLDTYLISSDKSLLQINVIHKFLSEEAYWCLYIPKKIVEYAIEHSFCIGIYTHEKQQVGFARIITDYATFGYLADVFVLNQHRGKGLSKGLMAAVVELPWIQGLRNFSLRTRDAQGLYEQFGFAETQHPERSMQILKSDIYKNN